MKFKQNEHKIEFPDHDAEVHGLIETIVWVALVIGVVSLLIFASKKESAADMAVTYATADSEHTDWAYSAHHNYWRM